MTRLYLVRHGTHDLVRKMLVGRLPGVPLSQAGRVQAERLATFFRDLPNVAAVLSSPLERCLHTAAPIAGGLGLAVLESEALNELDCGAWTGLSFDDLATDPRWPAWNSERGRTVMPGGESAQAVQARIMTLVEDQAKEDRGPVVMVTHSDVIKFVVLTLLGASLDLHDRLEIEPASITTLDLWAGGGKIMRSNQVVT
jgi:broad specificity phosphatase PhoE